MVLPWPGDVPPIVMFVPAGRDAGPVVAEVDRPGHVGADEVAVDDVAGAAELEAVVEAGARR